MNPCNLSQGPVYFCHCWNLHEGRPTSHKKAKWAFWKAFLHFGDETFPIQPNIASLLLSPKALFQSSILFENNSCTVRSILNFELLILRSQPLHYQIFSRIDMKLRPTFFFRNIFQMITVEKSCIECVESQINGGKVDDQKPQLSHHLKNSTKTCFLAIKVPKPRGVIFCPPAFLPTFLREKKWFIARCSC